MVPKDSESTHLGQVDVALVKEFADSWVADHYQHLIQTVDSFRERVSDSALFRSTLIQLAIHDLSRRWAALADNQANSRPNGVRWYLDKFPELSDDGRPPIELLFSEFESRFRAGDHPKLAEYESEFAEYGDAVIEFKSQVHQRLSQLIDDTHAAAAFELSTIVAEGGESERAGDAPPRVLGDYQLTGELARGGMGVVFRAYHTKLHRTVALKMILAGKLAGEEEVKRFYSEAEAAAKLDHPGIVPIYEVGNCDGTHFFTMTLVEGRSLSQRIADGPLPVREAASLLLQVSQAVGYAHRVGIIHRDLKPSNILITTDGIPRVTDFGLAKSVQGDSGMTATGQVLGTPSYMPPEQAEGKIREVDSASDIYSLGAVLYCMLTGRPPYQASTVIETLRQVIEKPPVAPRLLNPSVDLDLETICLKCLEKRKQDRFESTDELGDEIQRYLNGETIRSRRVSIVTRAARWCRRKPLVVALAASLLIAATIGVFAVTAGRSAINSRRLATAEREFAANLEELRPTAESFYQHQRSISPIRNLSASAAERADAKLNALFASAIETKLRQPRQSAEQLDAIQPLIELLNDRHSQRLQELLRQRRTSWHLIASHTMDESAFAQRDLQRDGRGFHLRNNERLISIRGLRPGLTRVVAPSVTSDVTCGGDVRAIVTFDSNWQDYSEFGIQLRATEKTAYDFVVRVGGLRRADAADTIADAFSAGDSIVFEIRRGFAPLVRQTIAAGSLPDEPIRIEAISAGDSLLMRVADLPPIGFNDPFPLIGNTGVFGLRLPADLTVTEYEVFRRQAEAISPLENADLLLAKGEFEEALQLYLQQASQPGDEALQQESRFKAARSLLELAREDEAMEILKKLATDQGERWPPLAAIHLWALFLDREDHQQADAMFEFVSGRYDVSQLASLVPEDLREQILLKTDQPFHSLGMTLRYDPTWVANMQRSAAIDRLLSVDGKGTLETQLQLALAYRNSGRFEQALTVLQSQLENTTVGAGGNVFRHYTRCLRQLGRNEEAIDFLNKIIETKPDATRYLASLHMSRAWCHAGNEDWVAAKFDCTRALVLCRQSEYHSSKHEEIAADFALGFLAFRGGNRRQAEQHWRDGWDVGRELIESLPSMANTGALFALVQGALLGDVTENDFNMFLRVARKNESNAQWLALSNVVQTTTFTAAINHAWQTPQGLKLAEDLAFDRLPISDRYTLPVKLMTSSVIGFSTTGHAPAADQLSLMREMTESMFQGFVIDGSINNSHVLQLGMAWKGIRNFLGWDGVKDAFDAKRRGLTAYVLAHRFIRRKQDADVPDLFQEAIDGLADAPDWRRIAERDFQLWRDDQGRLVMLNASEQEVPIEILQNGEVVHTLNITPTDSLGHEVLLAPGKFTVRRKGSSGAPLVAETVFIARGSGREISLDSHGSTPLRNSIVGMIPRPAVDADGQQWQMFRAHNTTSPKCVAWHPDGQTFAIADNEKTTRIIDGETGNINAFLTGHRAAIRDIAWLADGVRLASCSYDSTIVWDTKRAMALAELPAGGQKHERIAADPKGLRVAVGSQNRLLLWDLNDQSVRTLFSTETWCAGVAWHPDGSRLATGWAGANGIRVININTGSIKHYRIDSPNVHGALPEFSNDGKKMVALQKDDLFIWNLDQPREPAQHHHFDRFISKAKWSRDDKSILVSHGAGPLRLLNLADGILSDHPAQIHDGGSFDIHPESGAIVRASITPTWQVINVGQEPRYVRLKYPHSTIRAASWCNENRLTLALSNGQLMDIDPVNREHALTGQVKRVTHVRWQPSGELLLCTSDGGQLHVLDEKLDAISVADLPGAPAAHSLTWHPSEKRFAVVYNGGEVLVFGNDFSKPERRIQLNDVSSVTDLCWNGNAKQLAIGTHHDGVHIATDDSEVLWKSPFKDQSRVVAWYDRQVMSGDSGRVELHRDNQRQSLLRGSLWQYGRLLELFARSDGTIISVWENGRIIRSTTEGHDADTDCSVSIRDAAYHAASDQLALVTGERTVEFFDLTTLQPILLFVLIDSGDAAWFTPSGRLIKKSCDLANDLLIQKWRVDGTVSLEPYLQ